MPTTPTHGLRYPALSDAPNVPLHMANLATDVDNLLALPTYAQLLQTTAWNYTSGGWHPIQMQSEDFDVNNGHSTSSNPSRWYPGRAGVFAASGGIAWAPNSDGRRGVRLVKNGTTAIRGSASITPATPASLGNSGVPMRLIFFQLGASDYIELYGFQDSGITLSTIVDTLGGEGTTLSVWMVHKL